MVSHKLGLVQQKINTHIKQNKSVRQGERDQLKMDKQILHRKGYSNDQNTLGSFSASFIIREMCIKATMHCNTQLPGWAKCKQAVPSISEDTKRLGVTFSRRVELYSRFLKIICHKVEALIMSINFYLEIHCYVPNKQNAYFCQKTPTKPQHARLFTPALSLVAPKLKTPQMSKSRMEKLWFIQVIETRLRVNKL